MIPGTLVPTDIAIGKSAVFYSPTPWDFASDLHSQLQFLGYTEGEVTLPFNETFNMLTTPEYTGDAPHEAYVQGEAPVATIPLYVADPALRAILSPTGGASGGYKRQLPVVKRTLVIVPEALFVGNDPQQQEEEELVPTGTGWTLGGVALTTAQQELLEKGMIHIWRGYFQKPQLRWRIEEGGKIVEPVTFNLMIQSLAPNGHWLYTLGDPYDAGIDPLTGIIES